MVILICDEKYKEFEMRSC